MSTITKPRVPDGLRDLMKDLTKEILKEKPSDIYDFAENYFQSRLPEKENYAVKSFEESSGKYDFSYIQNPQRYQIPVALVYSIIPEGLTNLIKDLIKAVLREQPQNLCDFAVEYFRHIKSATSSESQAETKEINYSAYENYFINKERFLFTPYVKCTCGRTLGEAFTNSHQIENLISIHKIQNNDSAFQSKGLAGDDSNNNNVNKNTENNTIYYEKYMNSIYIIQRYIRRYLKEKHGTTKTNQVSPNHNSFNQHSMTTQTAISKQYEDTAHTIPIVPQLQLNQNEAENISEDASYTSASTALLSASESGRETSEPSTTESILTKTIMEGVEMENDEKNISNFSRQSTNDHVQDAITINNDVKEEDNNGNVAEETKDAAKSLDYDDDSRNEELETKDIDTIKNRSESDETDGKPVEDVGVKDKTNEETKTDINEINEKLASVDSGTISSTHTQAFNNQNENPSDFEGSNKKFLETHDADVESDKSSEHELSPEKKIIKREIDSNFTKEGNEVDNNNELDNKSTRTSDMEFTEEECVKSQEIKQTNLIESSGNNNSEIDGSMLQNNEKSKDEQMQSLDEQKDKVNTKSELLEEIPHNEIDEVSIRNSSDDSINEHNLHLKAESSTNVEENGNESKNEENSNNTDLLEKVMEITSAGSEKHDNMTEIETNEAAHNVDKIKNNANIEISPQESLNNELLEKNSTSIELDQNHGHELKKTRTQLDASVNNNNVSDFDQTTNDKEEISTQIDSNNTTLAEIEEGKLETALKDGTQNANLKLEDKSIQQKNNDEGKSFESIEKELEVKSENEKLNIDGTTMTNKIEIKNVDASNQETIQTTNQDELNKNSEVFNENQLDEKSSTDTNVGLTEKSDMESRDVNELDSNLFKKSEIVSDSNRSNSHDLLDKEVDLTDDKKSDDVIELKDDINKNLHKTSDEIGKDENKIDVEKHDKNLEESQQNKLVESMSKNNSIDTNDKFPSQPKKCETEINKEEIVQTEIKMKETSAQNSTDIDIQTKSPADSVETTTSKDAMDKDGEGVQSISDDIGKAYGELSESIGTSHTSGETNYNYNKGDDNVVADKSLIKTNIRDEITDKNNMQENEMLTEKNKSTDDLKVENELIQTQSQTKAVLNELSEKQEKDETSNEALQFTLDQSEKHEVNKIIKNSAEANADEKGAKNDNESSQPNLKETYNESSLNTNIEKVSDKSVTDIDTKTDKSDDSSNVEDISKIVLDKTTSAIGDNINLTSHNLSQKQQSESNLAEETEPTNNNDVMIIQKENVQTEVESTKNDSNIKTEEADGIKEIPEIKTSSDEKLSKDKSSHNLYQQSESNLTEDTEPAKNNEIMRIQKENVKTEVESTKNDSNIKTEEADGIKDIPEIKTTSDEMLSDDKNMFTNSTSSDKNVDKKQEPQLKLNDVEIENKLNTNMLKTSETKENVIHFNENIDDLAIKNAECNSEENLVKKDLKDELHKEISSNKLEIKNDDIFETEIAQIGDAKDHKIDNDVNKTEKLITKSKLLKESSELKSEESVINSSDEIINQISENKSEDTVNITTVKISPEIPKTNSDETTNKEVAKTKLEESSLNDNNMTDELINKTFTLKSPESTDIEHVNKNLEETLQTELNKNKNNDNVDIDITTSDPNLSTDLMLKHEQDANATEEIITKSCVQEIQIEKQNEVSNIKNDLEESKATESTVNIRNVEPSENDIENIDKSKDSDEILKTKTSSNELDKPVHDSDEYSNSENKDRIKRETAIETPIRDDNTTTENKNTNIYKSNDHQTKDQSEATFEEDNAKQIISDLNKTDTSFPTKEKHHTNPITIPINNEGGDQSDQNEHANTNIDNVYEQKEVVDLNSNERFKEQIQTNEANSKNDQEGENKSQEKLEDRNIDANSDSIKAPDGNTDTTSSAAVDRTSDSKSQLEFDLKTPSINETLEGRLNPNSDSIKENYENIDDINSAVDTTEIETEDQINDNTSKQEIDFKTTDNNETVEQRSLTEQTEESQTNESEIKNDNVSSLYKLEVTNKMLQVDVKPFKDSNDPNEIISPISKHEESLENHEEKTSMPIDINIKPNEAETNCKNSTHIDQNLKNDQHIEDKEEKTSKPIDANITQYDEEKSNLDINSKNSTQIVQDLKEDQHVKDKEEIATISIDTKIVENDVEKSNFDVNLNQNEQNLNDDHHVGDKDEKTSIPIDTNIAQIEQNLNDADHVGDKEENNNKLVTNLDESNDQHVEDKEEKTSKSIDTNIAQNDIEKSNYEINSKNSTQIEQVFMDEEKNNKSFTNLDDSNAELILEKEGNKEHDVKESDSNEENIQKSNHGNNMAISKSSLKSDEIETLDNKDSDSELRNKREVKNYPNDDHKLNEELGDTLKIVTTKDEELKQTIEDNTVLGLGEKNVIGENISSNESETIQPDSVKNILNLSEPESLLNDSNNETSLEKDYQLKTSFVNDNEINSPALVLDNKSLDLNMNKRQSSTDDNQIFGLGGHQNENITIKLLHDENVANAKNQTHTDDFSNLPPEKESNDKEIPSNLIRTSSSNQLVDNDNIHSPDKGEKENFDRSTIKHIEGTESINKNIDGASDAVNKENNNNAKLVSPDVIRGHEIESIDKNTETVNSSKDQSSLGDDKSKNEFELSTKELDLQTKSNIAQDESDAVNVNEKESVQKENIMEETHADTKDDDKIEGTTDSCDTSSQPTILTYVDNIDAANKASQENFKKENIEQTNADVTEGNINDEVYFGKETTHNIGIQTPETFIGNQNLTIGRIRNFNEGLLGSFSGQRFAETHLRSFWKEYVMNNSMPLSKYDYRENEPKEQSTAGTSQQYYMDQVNKTNLPDHDNNSEEQTISVVEPEIIKETIVQSESSPIKNHNISRTTGDSTPSKDIERIPRYFYGVPDTEPNNNASQSKRKSYKEPTAFTITMGDSNKKHTTKIAKTIEEPSPKSHKDVESLKNNMKLNLAKLDLSDNVDAEPLLDAETPTKLFQDLNQFEYEIHDVDLDITYTIDEIIRLKIENDSQNNSDDNDENVNEFSEYSLTPEPMLQTIIELSESETPKPPDQLHSIDEDFLANLERISDTTSTSWTTGSKEDNSFISDEFLDEKNHSEYIKEAHTKSESGNKTLGGIYEFAKDDMAGKEMKSQEYEEIIAQAPTPPNDDPFYEDLKDNAAKTIQGAYRQFIQKRMLKPVENVNKLKEKIEKIGGVSNTEKLNIENDENLSHDGIKSDGSTENSEIFNIKNNENLIVPDGPNNTKLDSEEIIPKIDLQKDVNATNSKQEFIYKNGGISEENTEKLNIDNEENLTSQNDIDNSNKMETHENNQQIDLIKDVNIITITKPIDTESFDEKDKNNSKHLVSFEDISTNQIKPENINTIAKTSCSNVNIEFKQEPMVKEDLIVKHIKNNLETAIIANNESNCGEKATLDEKNIDSSQKKGSTERPDIGKIESVEKLKEELSGDIETSSLVRQIEDSNIDVTNKDLAFNGDGANDISPNSSINQSTENEIKSSEEKHIDEFSSKEVTSNTNTESSNNIKDTNIDASNTDLIFNEVDKSQKLGRNEPKESPLKEKLSSELNKDLAFYGYDNNDINPNDSTNQTRKIYIKSTSEKHMEGLNSKLSISNLSSESSNNKDTDTDVTNTDVTLNFDGASLALDRIDTNEGRNNNSAEKLEEEPSSNNIRDTNIDNEIDIRTPEDKHIVGTSHSNSQSSNNIEDINIDVTNKDLAFNEDGNNDINPNGSTEIDIKSPEEQHRKEFSVKATTSNTSTAGANDIKDTNIGIANTDLVANEDDPSQRFSRNETKESQRVSSAEKLEKELESELASSNKVRPSSNNIRDTNIDKEIDIRSFDEKHLEELSSTEASSILNTESSNNIKDTNIDVSNKDVIFKDTESQKLGRNETKESLELTSTEKLNSEVTQGIEESSNSIKDTNIDIKNKDLTFKEFDKKDVDSNDSTNQTKEIDIESPIEKLKEVLSTEKTTSNLERQNSNNIKNTNIDVTNKDLTFNENNDKNNKDSDDSTNQTKQIDTNKSENSQEESTKDSKLTLSNIENKANEAENQSNDNLSEIRNSTNIFKNDNINNEIIINNLKESSKECDKIVHDDHSSDQVCFEPTAPAEEDIQSVASIENIESNPILQDQAARKIQKAVKNYIERKSKLSSNLGTTKDSLKSNWFVGDEPIIAKDTLTKTTSEIPFEETEAYVELTTNPSQYLVDSSSNLEAIDANNFSRSPTAPVSKRSINSVDLVKDQSSNVSKETVSVLGTEAGVIDNAKTDDKQVNAKNLIYRITSNDVYYPEKETGKQSINYTHLLDDFLNSERHYSEAVNHRNKEIIFTSPDVTEITKILSDFRDPQNEQFDSVIPYERLEEPCIKKSVSRTNITDDDAKDAEIIADTAISTDTSSSSDIDDTEDSLSTKTVKLHKPDVAITKMQQRRDSTTKISNVDKPKDYNFDEPLVTPMDNLDTDEEGIVVNKLQREDTRESSAQSDFDVIIGGDKDDNFNFLDSIDIDETFPAKGSLKRVHTIAGDGDAKSLLKNVTIDESIKYIEPPEYELNSGSLCLDDDTAENIRRKMMAYSFSEADSDCFDKTTNNNDGANSESKTQKYDDFNVSTALVENGDSSTETESTIVSAVTKIQAGARGYLTRKRLGKASMTSDGKSMPHDDMNKASFGNAAISESLEYLVQEAAAKRIQKVYRQHYRKKLAEINQKEDDDSSSPEFTTSLESTLAQKRSIMLQRGDALRNDSTPDEGNSSSNGSGNENSKLNAKTEGKSKNKNLSCSDESNNNDKLHLKEKTADNDNLNATSTSSAKTAATIRAKKIEENKIRWLAMRQNSMPVQIDSEVLRVIPKYMRKKIKSAEGEKKKDRRRLLMD